VRLASALGHVQNARRLSGRQQFDQALSEAQAAVTLAPDALSSQMVLGDMLTAMHRNDEARSAYEKALIMAKTMEPSAQEIWAADIQKKLASK
jgi:Flp pilus assembly protein TadD